MLNSTHLPHLIFHNFALKTFVNSYLITLHFLLPIIKKDLKIFGQYHHFHPCYHSSSTFVSYSLTTLFCSYWKDSLKDLKYPAN
mmetsp:Transcript_5710/g.6232  ORF Transcript_5710/g.6232 Transcript_5710/m.6232 type:complete len:84 (-) Transcript_5710:561-812(-)